MGYGSYSAADWNKLRNSRNLSDKKDVHEVFARISCNPKFDPRYIGIRECFDSEDHPRTTPIVIGLDVTGSMGYLAVQVAQESLNELIMKLYSTQSVEDPALMCAAYGDYGDSAPLQVTQFESDIRIVEQLLDLYIEHRGNGEVVPTCLWSFLTNHTNIDAINKRGEKGFVFTIGDTATIRSSFVPETIERVIGDKMPRASLNSILKDIQKTFHVFHIMIGSGGNDDLLPGHMMNISRTEIDSIPEIVISTIQMQKGMEINKAIRQWDEIKRPVIRAAVSQLKLTGTGRTIRL